MDIENFFGLFLSNVDGNTIFMHNNLRSKNTPPRIFLKISGLKNL